MRELSRGTRSLVVAPVLALCLCLGGVSARAGELEDRVKAEVPELQKTYEYLHAHPELSFQEEKTSAYVAGRLRQLGFEVTEGFGHYDVEGRVPHGVVGVLKNGDGPTVLVRTDLDALPITEATGLPYASQVRAQDDAGNEVGVMHACGHDLHMTSFLGTAAELAGLRDRWRGTLVMIGQPAEERGNGARAMLAGGLYERFGRPDYALALHTNASLEAGKVGVVPGYALANVDSVDITVRGRGGHGSRPENTNDPVTLAAYIVVGLQPIVSRRVSPFDPAVVTVGSIHGGTKHNIIPDQVTLQLTVRSYEAQVRRQLLDGIREVAVNTARAQGFPEDLLPVVDVEEQEATSATYNDPELTGRLERVFAQALGADRVVEMSPVMGGEDFSCYALDRKIPSMIFWLGGVDPAKKAEAERTGTPLPSLHSSLLAPLPAPAIRTGVTAMTAAVLDLMGT
jgi:amidohydrolase